MSGYNDYNPQYGFQQPQQGYSQPAPPPPPAANAGMHLPPGGSWILPPSQAGGNGGLPKQILGNTELVKVTAKSCSNCRTRKVKCDRRYPDCSRCVKRKETCDYGDDVSIALRPTWVLATESSDDSSPSATVHPSPAAVRPPYQPAPPALRPPYAGSAYPYPPPRAPPAEAVHEQSRSFRSVSNMQHHQALTKTRRTDEDENGAPRENFSRLWETFLSASNLGASSSDWRLAVPTMASSLTVHLIDASMHSCCFHLPAFHAFAPFVNYYKENVTTLDLASQVVVGILTSLGARASPHSALLGIAGPDIENGKASLDLVLSAGQRRENAWRAIVNRATELCSKPEILQVPSARNAQTLVAFVQMLMLAEAKPKTARFFLRTAMGVFRDMQHSDLSPEEVQAIKSAVGPTLYESDSRIAAYLSMPVVISDGDLDEYFEGTDVRVIDLATEDLGPLLDDILDPSHGRITRTKLDRALGLTGYFVCAVQRCFSSISSSRKVSPRFLTAIPQLWSYVDRAHAAVQRLHRRLVQLDYVPEGCDEHHSVDYDLLIGVRMDERLLDVVHLAHEWLKKQRMSNTLSPDNLAALEELLATSERRVRKCLKLLAFYSKVFVDSLDKHVVYHLFTQLEALPDWATMAAQREGEMTEFGPLPGECALTEVELDWFTAALELACFFTPLGHERLQQLTAARNARRRPETVVDQWTFDLSVPTPAATPAQARDIQVPLPLPHSHAHGHTHPASHNRQTGSPTSTWQFDAYGTPLGIVDNVSPPSMYDQTPGSSGSGTSSEGHHHPQQQQQHPPPFGHSAYNMPSSTGADGFLPPPPHTLPHLAPISTDHNGYAYTASGPHSATSASGSDRLPSPSGLDPSAVLANNGGGGNLKRDSIATPGTSEPSWLAGYDYSAMLSAEASRTGQTPRGSMSVGATITELPDEPNGAGGLPLPMPPPVSTSQAGMAMGMCAQVPLGGGTPQAWGGYNGGGGTGGGW
ncbi:hypothetical protein JCM6882_004273 [Rhodosporidiobolus microsporus]